MCVCMCVCVFRPECEKQVKGYPAAVHQKFKTRGEAEAFVWSKEHCSSSGQQSHAMPHNSSESPDPPASGQSHSAAHGKYEASQLAVA